MAIGALCIAESTLEAQTPAQPHVSVLPIVRPPGGAPGFTLMTQDRTGVTFTNVLSDTRAAENQIRLNGSGVAAGDVDGDGLCDLYFCGLENRNTLYRNLGDWRFEDITASASVACADQFSSGTVLADLDGDGDLDLLVGSIGRGVRFFRNDGRAHFTEAPDAGLIPRYCVTSFALADVDGDGDIDLYVCNYRTTTVRSTGMELLRVGGRRMLRPEDREDYELTPEGRLIEHGEPDILYLNDGRAGFSAVSWTGGAFVDAAGKPLAHAPRDWTLSAMFRDINQDGAPDLYVCGDFHSPDHFWLNDGAGHFREAPPLALRHTSTFSMAVDFADVNRDGFDDFFVADMLGVDHSRRLMQAAGAEPETRTVGVFNDRPQYDRSMLQVNRGDGTFAEIGYLAGVEANDWTWSALFLDVDLDGFEDLLCNTGHAFDTQDLDADMRIAALGRLPREKIPGKLLLYPRLAMARLAFRNRGDLTFEDTSKKWGFDWQGVSHGMALADLDNDGDLDVIANNLNAPAAIYRNDAPAARVAVRLHGQPPNTQALGARITLSSPSLTQSQEVIAGGHYLSGTDPLRVFACPPGGPYNLEVRWRNGRMSRFEEVQPDRLYDFREHDSIATPLPPATPPPRVMFTDVSGRLAHVHRELQSEATPAQPLLPIQLGQAGPGVAWADLNNDGWDDLLVGGATGGRMGGFINDHAGGFAPITNGPFAGALGADQCGIIFLPLANGAGGVLAAQSGLGKGSPSPMTVVEHDLRSPTMKSIEGPVNSSPGPIAAADYDGDGQLDLFVGGRSIPGRYPEAAASVFLRHDGAAFAVDTANSRTAAALGLVVGAVFCDVDGDGDPDLILGCDWGPIRVLNNEGGIFRDVTGRLGLAAFTGRWSGVATGDFDADGRMDIVAANWGLNSAVRTSGDHPYALYYADLDGNGSIDIVEAGFDPRTGRMVPMRDFTTMSAALPFLRERFPTFASFGEASVADVLGAAGKTASKVEARWLASTVFLNRVERFEAVTLPLEGQLSPAFGVCVADFDGDGALDVVLGQNTAAVHGMDPRQDAGRGLLLRGDGRGGFTSVPGQVSGIRVYGDQRGVATADFDQDGRPDLALAQNGASTILLRNETGRPGLRVRLQGPAGNPTGVGARLRLLLENGAGPVQEVHAGGGYYSQDSAVLVMAKSPGARWIEIRWPGGRTVKVPVAKDQLEVVARP